MIKIQELIWEIDSLEKHTISDGAAILIEHIIFKYQKNGINVKPKYQRIFRWDKEQKSKLIESLLLWIPLPSFFVAEDQDGKREIVDWLQRISTILEFIWDKGFIKQLPEKRDNSIEGGLEEWQYLKNLKWITWNTLPEKYKNRILNSKIYVSIIKNTWDIKAKFELFQRLNTLGTELSSQESRNCLLVDKNEKIYDKILFLSETKEFSDMIANVKDEKKKAKQDMELVLRYIALKNTEAQSNISIWDLIDDLVFKLTWIESKYYKSMVFDIDNESNIFLKTFKFIHSLNTKAFDKKWKNQLIYPLFDTIATWIWYNIEKWNIDPSSADHIKTIKAKIETIQSNSKYISWTRSWQTSEMKLKFARNFWKEYFKI